MLSKSPNKLFFPVMVAALVTWCGLLALGAFLGPDFWRKPEEKAVATTHEDQANAPPQTLVQPFDWRKPLVVMAFAAIFLGVWALALWSRQVRLDRRSAEAVQEARATKHPAPGSRH